MMSKTAIMGGEKEKCRVIKMLFEIKEISDLK